MKRKRVTLPFHENVGDRFDWAAFEWNRPATGTGFNWHNGVASPRSEVKRFLGLTPGTSLAPYAPLATEPALSRTFVDLEPTEAEFLRFANRFGALGFEGPFWPCPQGLRKTLNRYGVFAEMVESGAFAEEARSGEELRDWLSTHLALRRVVSVMDAVKARDVKVLSRSIRWDDREAAIITWREAGNSFDGAITARSYRPAVWHAAKAMATRRGINLASALAEFWIQDQVNTNLSGKKFPWRAASPALTHDALTGRFGLQVVPSSLVAAMWLQCAQSIDHNQQFRRCDKCRGWFLISPDGAGRRRHTRFCSDRCRLRSWRERPPSGKRSQTQRRSK